MRARTVLPVLTVAAALALTGCGSTTPDAADTPAPTSAPTSGTAVATTQAEEVTIEDAWVKAADSGMSAAFGRITSTGEHDVTIVQVTSPASTVLEMHETVEDATGAMVMQPKQGGFTIAAGGSLTLEPGADHIMLMDLVAPIVAGDEIDLTLTFSDGSSTTVTAPAKDYAGANESYAGGEEHAGMDMGDQ